MYKRKVFHPLFFVTVIVLVLASCNLPNSQATNEKPTDVLFTQAAQTVIVQLTISAAQTQAVFPSATQKEQSPTEIIQPTETTIAETPQPSETATEEIQPTPSATPTTESPYPVISASINTNCRSGADPSFEIVGYLLVGEPSFVHGQDPWGYWWYIENPNHPGKFCWVWRETTIVEGDTSKIPIKQPPPTYTPTPTNTPTLTFTPTP